MCATKTCADVRTCMPQRRRTKLVQVISAQGEMPGGTATQRGLAERFDPSFGQVVKEWMANLQSKLHKKIGSKNCLKNIIGGPMTQPCA